MTIDDVALVALRDNLAQLRDRVQGNEQRPAADTIAARLTYAVTTIEGWLIGGAQDRAFEADMAALLTGEPYDDAAVDAEIAAHDAADVDDQPPDDDSC